MEVGVGDTLVEGVVLDEICNFLVGVSPFGGELSVDCIFEECLGFIGGTGNPRFRFCGKWLIIFAGVKSFDVLLAPVRRRF